MKNLAATAICMLIPFAAYAQPTETAHFQKCQGLQERSEWSDAASCYVDFHRAFPDSDLTDDALFNGALCFDQLNELGKAIQLRIMLLKVAPDSPMAPSELLRIGGNYHALAVFAEAAKFYELYADNFPREPEARTALANAATFRHGLGQYDLAITNFEKYLTLFGDDPGEAARVRLYLAELKAKAGDVAGALASYKEVLEAKGNDDATTMQALIARAKLVWDTDRDAAMDDLKRALRKHDRLSTADQERIPARFGPGQVRFMRGQHHHERARAIVTSKLSKAKWRAALLRKASAADDAIAEHEAVAAMDDPDYAIRALVEIGGLYEELSGALRDGGGVTNLKAKERRRVDKLWNGASPDELAVVTYGRAVKLADDEGRVTEELAVAMTRLSVLRPKKYRPLSERYSQPGAMKDGFARAPIDLSR